MRSIKKLRAECDELGIDWKCLPKGKQFLQSVIAEIKTKGMNVIPQIPVMLGRDFKDVKPDVKKSIMEDEAWLIEPKLDGVRFKLHILDGTARMDSRRISDTLYIYSEKTDNFPHITKMTLFSDLDGTVIDGEIMINKKSIDTGSVITEGTLSSSCAVVNSKPEKAVEIQRTNDCWAEFHVFDILFYKGHDVRDKRYQERRALLDTVINRIYEANEETVKDYIKIVPFLFRDNKEEIYLKFLGQGYEGAMLKHIDGKYCKKEGSRSNEMYKWKQFYTIDAFVTGYVAGKSDGEFRNLVGALEFSVIFNKKIHIIAYAQPGDLEFRKAISMQDNNENLIGLDQNQMNRVAEIKFQTLTKLNRGRHAVVMRWRPDKNEDQCEVASLDALKMN